MFTRCSILTLAALATGVLPRAAHAQDTTHRRPVLRAGTIVAPQRTHATVAQVPVTKLRPSDIERWVGKPTHQLTIRRTGGQLERPDTGTVALHPGDMLGATVGDRTVWRRVGPVGTKDSTLTLPFRFLLATTADTQILLVTTTPTTLVFNADVHAFRGTVNLVLRDSLHPTRQGPLSPPVQFSAVVRGVGTADPGDFPLPHINLPPTKVTVTTTAAEDSIPLHLSTTLNPEGADVWLRVAHPQIELDPVQRTIWGFGLQKTAVHVTMPQEAGAQRLVVRLRAAHAEPEPDTLRLAGGETGTVLIRSTSVGTDTLWAEAGRFKSSPAAIIYSWPILFFIASLLGGLAGSAIAGRFARRRGKRTSRTAYVVSGILTGFFVAVAFAIGLNLTGIDIATQSGEAVVFVVAVLGAILGLPGIAKAVPTLGKALEGTASGG